MFHVNFLKSFLTAFKAELGLIFYSNLCGQKSYERITSATQLHAYVQHCHKKSRICAIL